MDTAWWNATRLPPKDLGCSSMLATALRREDPRIENIDTVGDSLGTPAFSQALPGWSKHFAASLQAERSCGSDSKLRSGPEELPLQADFNEIMRDWGRACQERQIQQDHKQKFLQMPLVQMPLQGKAELSCSRGGTDDFSEVRQDIEHLKYHLHEVQAQLMRNDLRAAAEDAQRGLHLTRFEAAENSLARKHLTQFEAAENSLASTLRTFAHHVIQTRMDGLEECMIDELRRGAAWSEQGEDRHAVSLSASMPRWSLPRWELDAAAKLREESWLLRQEAEQVAKSAVEDKRRMAQWESELMAEQREEARVARQELEQSRVELKEDKRRMAHWESEFMAEQRKEARVVRQEMSCLEERLQTCAGSDEQVRLSLQDIARVQREVKDIRLEFEDELRSLRATHYEFRDAQLKLEKGFSEAHYEFKDAQMQLEKGFSEARYEFKDAQMKLEKGISIQRAEAVEERKAQASDVRVAEPLIESQSVQSQLSMLLQHADSVSKHRQEMAKTAFSEEALKNMITGIVQGLQAEAVVVNVEEADDSGYRTLNKDYRKDYRRGSSLNVKAVYEKASREEELVVQGDVIIRPEIGATDGWELRSGTNVRVKGHTTVRDQNTGHRAEYYLVSAIFGGSAVEGWGHKENFIRKHSQDDHRIWRSVDSSEPAKQKTRSHAKLRDALTDSQQLPRYTTMRIRRNEPELWRP